MESLTYYHKSGTPQSRIFDDIGNEYLATTLQLGSSSGQDVVRTTLFVDIPVKTSLNFERVSVQADL